jgi:hypothetical protein
VPNAELIAECYIGFAKLLDEEMRAFDIKDSALFDTLRMAGGSFKGNGSGTMRKNGGGASSMNLPEGRRNSSAENLNFKSIFSNSKKK